VVLDPVIVADFFPATFGSGVGVGAFLALAFGSDADATAFFGPCSEAALLGTYCAANEGSPTVDPSLWNNLLLFFGWQPKHTTP
jgi:hypothetical protein